MKQYTFSIEGIAYIEALNKDEALNKVLDLPISELLKEDIRLDDVSEIEREREEFEDR